MNAVQEINNSVRLMCKEAQAPGFVPSRSYYSSIEKVPSMIPQRWKDHALNTAVEGERGWWKFWNNVVPNTPVYISQLLGGTMGGIKGAYGSSLDKHPNVERLSRKPGVFGALAREAKYLGYLKDTLEGAYQGYDSFGEIAKNKWQKPARKWQDILFPYLSQMDSKTKDLSSQLKELREWQGRNGNVDAVEDLNAARKLEHLVPFATGAAVLGKTTEGFGTFGNSR